jgi:NADPH-dependent curcumin reductase CurA
VTVKGFIILDYTEKFPAAWEDLSRWLQEGKIRRKEHVVKGGIEAAPQALVDLYAGANTGKMLLEVAPVTEPETETEAAGTEVGEVGATSWKL